ncbi:glycosyltransferase family 2 protein [Pontibacter ruber]|uniref:Glycosyltransferase family 2 protein n=1 Tax=Pontibacter ruber TaxID=1343895 RepID=A0ABW5CUX1_9BACT|nr:glycosyltransferase family A protein [Pontibacter ruber]
MKFSVIIPTYKRLDLLKAAVDSVHKQTYQHFEIIIVNDNPDDKEAIDSCFSGVLKTKVIHHSEARGGNAARNSGILSATGDLIAFLDDDDHWLPAKLQTHLKVHQKHPDAGLVFSDCLYVYNNPFKKNHSTSYHTIGNVLESMAQAKFCPATSSMVTINRQCLEKCGLFDVGLISFQDWDYWFRIAHHFSFVYIPVVLVHFNQHLIDRTSQNEHKRQAGIRQICKKWGSEIDTEKFTRLYTRNMYYKNSFNALMAGQGLFAIRKGLKLFSREVISVKSVSSFFGIVSMFLIQKLKSPFSAMS